MGSSLSRNTGRIARTAQESSRWPKERAGGGRHEILRTPNESGVHRRQTSDEWAEMLKRVSGVISSTAWDDADREPVISRDVKMEGSYQHAARRSLRVSQKLPSSPLSQSHPRNQPDVNDNSLQKAGGLAHKDIIELFHLRRSDAKVWDAPQLAQRFNISENDIRHLLAFSRTYLPRIDPDGVTRGYYDPKPHRTIVRFEAD